MQDEGLMVERKGSCVVNPQTQAEGVDKVKLRDKPADTSGGV